MSASRDLFIDITNNRLVSGLDNSSTPRLNFIFYGDTQNYNLFFLTPRPETATAFEPVYLNLGGSVLTPSMMFCEPLPATSSAWSNTLGGTFLPTTATAAIAQTMVGSATTNEQQQVTFSREAFSGSFLLTIPNRSITISEVAAGAFRTSANHGLATSEVVVVTGFSTGITNGMNLIAAEIISPTEFLASTQSGGATLTATATAGIGYTITATSPVMDVRINPADMESAMSSIASIGEGNISVTGDVGKDYLLTYQVEKSQIPIGLATITSTAISSLGGFGGIAVSATGGTLPATISGQASVNGTLEISAVGPVGTPTIQVTYLQQAVNIQNVC